MLISLIVVTISQCMCIWSHHLLHLKCIQFYLSIRPQKAEKNEYLLKNKQTEASVAQGSNAACAFRHRVTLLGSTVWPDQCTIRGWIIWSVLMPLRIYNLRHVWIVIASAEEVWQDLAIGNRNHEGMIQVNSSLWWNLRDGEFCLSPSQLHHQVALTLVNV